MSFTPRTIDTIQQQIIQSKDAQSALSGLNSTSQVAYWKLWTFIEAVAINLLEQIMAIFFGEIETIVAQAVPGTPPWIQSEVLKFQYGDVVQVNTDFTVGYPVINTVKQIISNAAVVVTNSGLVNIKVATGSPPGPLDGSPGTSGPEVVALNAYLNSILPACINYNIINEDADTLQVNANVFYNGQYNATIQATVITALEAYMSALPFNGLVKISDIEKTILAIPGVVDVVFTQITAVSAPGSSVNLVLGSTELTRSYQTYAGYIINAVAPNDFDTTLTFTVATQ